MPCLGVHLVWSHSTVYSWAYLRLAVTPTDVFKLSPSPAPHTSLLHLILGRFSTVNLALYRSLACSGLYQPS